MKEQNKLLEKYVVLYLNKLAEMKEKIREFESRWERVQQQSEVIKQEVKETIERKNYECMQRIFII